MGILRKRDKGQASAESSEGLDDTSQVRGDFPALWEFLALDRWEDGSRRVPGTLTLFIDQARFKACLSDRDTDTTAFLSASSLQGILDKIEQGLVEDDLDWRSKPKHGKKN